MGIPTGIVIDYRRGNGHPASNPIKIYSAITPPDHIDRSRGDQHNQNTPVTTLGPWGTTPFAFTIRRNILLNEQVRKTTSKDEEIEIWKFALGKLIYDLREPQFLLAFTTFAIVVE